MPHGLSYFHLVHLVLSVIISYHCRLLHFGPLAFADDLAYRTLLSKAACSH